MNTKELEMAIDRAQFVLRWLSEARALRRLDLNSYADSAEKSALFSLEDLADMMGVKVVADAREVA